MTNTQSQNRVEVDQHQPEVKRDQLDGVELAQIALDAALDKKALEPLMLDVRGLCSYTDYILVVSGRSDRQVDAIAEGVRDALRLKGKKPLGTEGMGHWSLLDFGDLVVHVFLHSTREHYALESLWVEAKRVDIDVPPEARVSAEDMY